MARQAASLVAAALVFAGCARLHAAIDQHSPLTAAELAPIAGAYRCTLYARNPMRHPGPRGSLVIHPGGAYAFTAVDGSRWDSGTVVAISALSFDNESRVVFSGRVHPMNFIPGRRALHQVYKSMTAFDCVRTVPR